MGEAPGTLTGNEGLKDLGHWDSIAVVEFLAAADTSFNWSPSAKAVAECKSVADLIALFGERIVG